METPYYYFGHGQTVLDPSIQRLLDKFKNYCIQYKVKIRNENLVLFTNNNNELKIEQK